MSTFLQILLINLVVSCDNVGVIAMATRDLPEDKAASARRLGIGLSLVLKLVFIGITGFLFSIPWLHIRIIGGVMLIYVTWNMLRQSGNGHGKSTEVSSGDNFAFVIASIIAADISMSLDNVIAILSIVAVDGQAPDVKDMVLVVLGLLACVPVLLWFSGTVSRLMERFPLITYLCAGYLVFTAVRMIFEDETIALFFRSINFTFTTPAALLLGALVVLTSSFTGGAATTAAAQRRRATVPMYFFITLYALVLVGAISFLSTGPVFDGEPHSVERLYGFAPCGANAVYLIGTSPFLFTLCASIFVANIMDGGGKRASRVGYLGRMLYCMVGMVVFILLELTVCTVGLTATFGFGRINPMVWLTNLFLQLLLHCTYISVFCMVRVFVRGKAATVVLCMLLLFVETVVVDICMLERSWVFVAGFLPDYYITTLPHQLVDVGFLLHMVYIAAFCIFATTCVGRARYSGRVGMKKLAVS